MSNLIPPTLDPVKTVILVACCMLAIWLVNRIVHRARGESGIPVKDVSIYQDWRNHSLIASAFGGMLTLAGLAACLPIGLLFLLGNLGWLGYFPDGTSMVLLYSAPVCGTLTFVGLVVWIVKLMKNPAEIAKADRVFRPPRRRKKKKRN